MKYEVKSDVPKPNIYPEFYRKMCKAQINDAISLLENGPDSGPDTMRQQISQDYWDTMDWIFAEEDTDNIFCLSACLEAVGDDYSVRRMRDHIKAQGLYRSRRGAKTFHIALLPGHKERSAKLVYRADLTTCPNGHKFSEVGARFWGDGSKRCVLCNTLDDNKKADRNYCSFWTPVHPGTRSQTWLYCKKGHRFVRGTHKTNPNRCPRCHKAYLKKWHAKKK